MVSTKTEIEKAAIKGPIKDLMTRISNFFITFMQDKWSVMETSKVTLSPQEWALVQDPSVIFTKNLVIEKVYALMGQVAESYLQVTAGIAAAEKGDWLRWTPKIAKGERYLDLPWVMLDYPRYYAEDNTRAMRSFFSWGNGFSLHLILQGSSRDYWLENISRWKKDAKPGWMLDMSDNPWQHHYDMRRLVPVSAAREEDLKQQSFIKYSCWQPLTDWEKIPAIWTEIFSEWIKIPGI